MESSFITSKFTNLDFENNDEALFKFTPSETSHEQKENNNSNVFYFESLSSNSNLKNSDLESSKLETKTTNIRKPNYFNLKHCKQKFISESKSRCLDYFIKILNQTRKDIQQKLHNDVYLTKELQLNENENGNIFQDNSSVITHYSSQTSYSSIQQTNNSKIIKKLTIIREDCDLLLNNLKLCDDIEVNLFNKKSWKNLVKREDLKKSTFENYKGMYEYLIDTDCIVDMIIKCVEFQKGNEKIADKLKQFINILSPNIQEKVNFKPTIKFLKEDLLIDTMMINSYKDPINTVIAPYHFIGIENLSFLCRNKKTLNEKDLEEYEKRFKCLKVSPTYISNSLIDLYFFHSNNSNCLGKVIRKTSPSEIFLQSFEDLVFPTEEFKNCSCQIDLHNSSNKLHNKLGNIEFVFELFKMFITFIPPKSIKNNVLDSSNSQESHNIDAIASLNLIDFMKKKRDIFVVNK